MLRHWLNWQVLNGLALVFGLARFLSDRIAESSFTRDTPLQIVSFVAVVVVYGWWSARHRRMHDSPEVGSACCR